MPKTIEEVQQIVSMVRIARHTFIVGVFAGSAVIYLQDSYVRPDAITTEEGIGYGRKWHISPHATDSEIVLTCLKAAITNAEHEVREGFEYRGCRIFQPHQDVDALVEVCGFSDARPDPTGAPEHERAEFLG